MRILVAEDDHFGKRRFPLDADQFTPDEVEEIEGNLSLNGIVLRGVATEDGERLARDRSEHEDFQPDRTKGAGYRDGRGRPSAVDRTTTP